MKSIAKVKLRKQLQKILTLDGSPTLVNVCKRSLLTCCHLCTCSRFGLSPSPNHRLSYVTIDQSPYRQIYHTYRYYLRAFYHTYRYYLRSHFGQLEILSGILYIYSIYAQTTMMPLGQNPAGATNYRRRVRRKLKTSVFESFSVVLFVFWLMIYLNVSFPHRRSTQFLLKFYPLSTDIN